MPGQYEAILAQHVRKLVARLLCMFYGQRMVTTYSEEALYILSALIASMYIPKKLSIWYCMPNTSFIHIVFSHSKLKTLTQAEPTVLV